MTKWRVKAEFTMDVQDEAQARRVAVEFMEGVAAGSPIYTEGMKSPEVAMHEFASDPLKAASALSMVLIGQSAGDANWLEISDIQTKLDKLG